MRCHCAGCNQPSRYPDPALLRPAALTASDGTLPGHRGRVAILKVHARGKPLAEDVDLDNIAKRTPFATGADLENIMNEGAIIAARYKQEQIFQEHLIEAVERVRWDQRRRAIKCLRKTSASLPTTRPVMLLSGISCHLR